VSSVGMWIGMLIRYIMSDSFTSVDNGVYIRGMRHEYLTPVTCKKIYRLTRHICRTDYGIGDEDAADISQALLLDLFRKRAWERYPVRFESLSWASKWIHYAIQRWCRDQGRQDHATESPLYAPETPQEPIKRSDYETELRKIPPASVPILQLKLYGYADKEILGVTGMHRDLYDKTLFKMRSILREQYPGLKAQRACTGKQPHSDTPVYAPPLWA